MPLAPVPGVHDQLGGRWLHRVGVLQLGVPDEFAVDGEQQMGHTRAFAPAQLQPALLGHRLLPVGAGGLGEQGEDGLGLLRRERGMGVDRAGAAGLCDVVAGHAYEGTGSTGKSAARSNQAVTTKTLSRYAR
ncbi:hypothetical protein QFZ43_004750 [Streptomyces afghaniensis]|nr:hypothetical protein [Streptomyces afghaniensis]